MAVGGRFCCLVDAAANGGKNLSPGAHAAISPLFHSSIICAASTALAARIATSSTTVSADERADSEPNNSYHSSPSIVVMPKLESGTNLCVFRTMRSKASRLGTSLQGTRTTLTRISRSPLTVTKTSRSPLSFSVTHKTSPCSGTATSTSPSASGSAANRRVKVVRFQVSKKSSIG
ncbi:hypothetical protein RHECNPAF_2330053 [Rhizobium etli CNPAF512]|nr:hypothetical protein RHECNPAF_2330053 [Rhizobium etli CNPAF512]